MRRVNRTLFRHGCRITAPRITCAVNSSRGCDARNAHGSTAGAAYPVDGRLRCYGATTAMLVLALALPLYHIGWGRPLIRGAVVGEAVRDYDRLLLTTRRMGPIPPTDADPAMVPADLELSPPLFTSGVTRRSRLLRGYPTISWSADGMPDL